MATNETKKIDDETGPRAFAVLLQQIADGDAHKQLSEDLQALIKVMTVRSREQCKTVAGALTFTLKLACDESGTLDLAYVIKRTEPQPKRARTVFWADKHGNMTAQNPKQIELGLRDVSSKRNDTREPAAPAVREV